MVAWKKNLLVGAPLAGGLVTLSCLPFFDKASALLLLLASSVFFWALPPWFKDKDGHVQKLP